MFLAFLLETTGGQRASILVVVLLFSLWDLVGCCCGVFLTLLMQTAIEFLLGVF